VYRLKTVPFHDSRSKTYLVKAVNAPKIPRMKTKPLTKRNPLNQNKKTAKSKEIKK